MALIQARVGCSFRLLCVVWAASLASACGDSPADEAAAASVGDVADADVADDSVVESDAAVQPEVDAGQDIALQPLPPSGPAPDFVPVATFGAHNVEVVETRQVIPAVNLPAESPAQTSNNNLDVIRHDGRVYLAWRTAPNHFASPDARVHVLSSADEQTWEWETSFARDNDLREPRFLSWNGNLWLYMAELGTNRLAFEPKGMLVSALASDSGEWSELTRVGPEGFIPWRTGELAGRPYMIGYTGGENIYLFNLEPLDIHLLTTSDGVTFTGWDTDQPVVERGGGSESAFAIDGDDRLWAVVRNESGDDSGWGSKLCYTPPGEYSDWTCVTDPRKFDSPLVFSYEGEIYLIGRRHLTPDGHYDLGYRDQTPTEQVIRYQAAYSQSPKRCALWRIDRTERRVRFMLDLPSNGDTCFASMLPLPTPGEFAIYDYSSDPSGPLLNWNAGQEGPTNIYRHVLRFTPND